MNISVDVQNRSDQIGVGDGGGGDGRGGGIEEKRGKRKGMYSTSV
jgi:hypothetical protein